MSKKRSRNVKLNSAIKEDHVVDDINDEEMDVLLQLTADEAVELTVILKDYLETL